MHWENPNWLLAWWLLPLVAGLLVMARRRTQVAARRFADEAMLPRLLPRALRRGVKGAAFVAALALLIAGAARPKWGVYFETVERRGADVFVLLDVSRSMMAEDVAPNRLGRAKSDIRDLLEQLRQDRVGLIVFAGASVLSVPLTTDHRYFLDVLDEVTLDSAPRGGSLIGDAIRKGIESMEPRGERDRAMVLITDGEDHDSFPVEAAKQAAERGIRIFAVGLGDTEEGRRIPVRDASGNLTYLQFEGQEVWSKMGEKTLTEIALSTQGAYVPAKTLSYDLGQIYREHLAKLARGELSSETRKRYADRFQWFLLAGFGLFLLDLLLPGFQRVNRRDRATL
jgi:Ca-activated chloride channel family protein